MLAGVFPAVTLAAVDIRIGIALPPVIVFETPPHVVVIPDTDDVYVVPEIELELFFWNGWWWRPWEGRWYRSRYYNRGWVYYDAVPIFYFDVDPGWRGYYREHRWHGYRWDYEPIPDRQLRQNWKKWHKNRYWEHQKKTGRSRIINLRRNISGRNSEIKGRTNISIGRRCNNTSGRWNNYARRLHHRRGQSNINIGRKSSNRSSQDTRLPRGLCRLKSRSNMSIGRRCNSLISKGSNPRKDFNSRENNHLSRHNMTNHKEDSKGKSLNIGDSSRLQAYLYRTCSRRENASLCKRQERALRCALSASAAYFLRPDSMI